MTIKRKAMMTLLALPLICLPVLSASAEGTGGTGGTSGAVQAEAAAAYSIELSRWGIYKDGTHPAETTKGINNALAWAHGSGIAAVTLPAGTYLIDKDSQINMVGNMIFQLTSDTVLQKETNGKESYQIMTVGYGADNVTLKGGTYRGDKDTHDYSKKDSPYSAGTHEGGYGILVQGAKNLTVEGIKAVNFTGDGLVLGGHGTLVKDLYAGSFESGSFDAYGRPVADPTKIRTKAAVDLSNPIFKTEHVFELSNNIKLPRNFDIYYYRADGSFIGKKSSATVRDQLPVPADAARFQLVFNQASTAGAYIEVWNRSVTKDAVVQNSEFAFNRRQGITVGGVDNALIKNNSFHDMKGTAPQSGIDVEGGFGENGFLNTNITIQSNDFYNNAVYDVILYDGHDALVEDNHLGSKGAIGLAVSDPFAGARIVGNHFDATRIVAINDADFADNRMNDSYTYFEGPNITIDGMELTDSLFAVSSKIPFGIDVSNIKMYLNNKRDSGLSLSSQPIHIKNMTIIGQSTLRSVSGSAAGSVFDNLKVIGYNSTYGLSLPPGTYNNCVFEGAEGSRFGTVSMTVAGKYTFNGCTFVSAASVNTGVLVQQANADVTISNSTFKVMGNSQAISVQTARNVVLNGNTVLAGNLTSASTELIKINDYWNRNDPSDVGRVVVDGNTISANLAAVGISTVYSGVGAPKYEVKDNTLYNATLSLKEGDNGGGNVRQ